MTTSDIDYEAEAAKPIVTIYSQTPCPACALTKRHLTKRGIPFTEVPIDSDEGIRLAALELDLRTAPIVCASTSKGEIYWDGFRPDRIDALVSANTPTERTNHHG